LTADHRCIPCSNGKCHTCMTVDLINLATLADEAEAAQDAMVADLKREFAALELDRDNWRERAIESAVENERLIMRTQTIEHDRDGWQKAALVNSENANKRHQENVKLKKALGMAVGGFNIEAYLNERD
jgi:hypothetical protein